MNKISQQRPLFFSIGLVLSCLLVIMAFEWKVYKEPEMNDWEGEFINCFGDICLYPLDIVEKEEIGKKVEIEIPEFERAEEPPFFTAFSFDPPVPKYYVGETIYQVDAIPLVNIPTYNLQPLLKPKILDLNCFDSVEDSWEIDVDFECFSEVLDSSANKIIKDTLIYIAPEEKAHPKEGYKAFYKFITQNLHYPDSVKRVGVEGKIFIQFVVEKDGSLSNFKSLKGDSQMSNEAIKVLKTTPKWIPARQNGVVVRSRYTIPIYILLK